MDFTIISLGNVEFLSMVLNGVAMICGTGNYTRLVAVGFVIGLLYVGFQCIFEGAQKINLHHTFLCFLCFLCMFGPSCTCVIEDAYTGKARTVDNLPLGVGVAGAAISGIGYGVTRMLEQGFGTHDRTSEHQFAEPLRIINKVRSVAQSEQLFQAINNELGTRANGAPSDSKQALINYLSECTMAKIQLGATSPTQLYSSTWDSEAFKFSSEAHTVLLPIGGMGTNEVVSCNAGYAKLNTIFQKFSSTSVKTAINQFLHLKNDDGTAISTNMDKVDSAMQALNATMNGSQDYMQMVVLEGVYKQAALKFYGSQQDTASAIAVNQGIMQRNTQWAGEGTMFLSASRALMAFFEGFIYAITPIMGFLIAIGSFGIGLVGKYFLTIAWIQLWLPILSILNLYIMTGARSAITDANLGLGASFYAIDTLWSETATWVATGGMLTAATPMLALFLVSGSTFAFTSLAGRLNGQDHFNERIGTPDAVSPSAVMSHAPHYQADRISGVRGSGSDAYVPKLEIGNILGNTTTSRAGIVNADQDNMTAQLNRTIQTGQSQQGVRQLQEAIGNSIASSMANGNQTALETLNNSAHTAGMTATRKMEALGALSMALSTGAGLDVGAKYGEFFENGKKVIKGGAIGKAAAALGVTFSVGANGDIKFTGTSTSTDSYTDSDSQSNQYGRTKSANNTKNMVSTLTQGYQAAMQNMSSKTWSDLANTTKGTALGQAFSKLATSTKSYENAVMANRSFGGKQSLSVTAMAEQLKGTSAGYYLANFERTQEGRNANLSANSQKYSDLFGGDLEKGKIAAALDYMSNAIENPGLQMKLGDVLADSRMPVLGITPENADKYKDNLVGPSNVDQKIQDADRTIQKGAAQIHNGKPSGINYSAAKEDVWLTGLERSGEIDQHSKYLLNSPMKEAQQRALHNLEQSSRASAMANFSNDWLRDGMVDSFAKYMKDTPAPNVQHQQTISNLSNAQGNYLKAYHDFQHKNRDSQVIQNLDTAFKGLRDEMSRVLYGTSYDDKDLTDDQRQQIARYTVAMANQIGQVHDLDNQAQANTITQFNTAFGVKMNP